MPRIPFASGIAGQLAILSILSLVLMHLVVLLWLVGRHGAEPPAPPDALLQRQAAAAWLLDRTAPEERPVLLAALLRDDPGLSLAPPPAPLGNIDWSSPRMPLPLRSLTGGMEAVVLPDGETRGPARRGVVFRLGDGTQLVALADSEGPPPLLGRSLLLTIVFLAISMTLLGVWATASLTAPLRRFSLAVEQFGNEDVNPVDLDEQGPDELRKAARAFNRMQRRIRGLLEDRTRMLAAIGHDLRTPITRLRLRADEVADPALKNALLRDLSHMDTLLQGGLAYLRDGRSSEPSVPIDLASLLQTVADEYSDAGHTVPFEGPAGVRVVGRPSELVRLFGNLVDNAIQHGGGGAIALSAREGFARIDITDGGPGIAAEDRERMLAPFARGDAARNMDGGTGFGLGLSICTAIVKGHRGTLELHDAAGGGLDVRIALPLA